MPWFVWFRREDPASRLRHLILTLERGEKSEAVGWGDRLLAAMLHVLRGTREIVLCWGNRSRGCATGFGIPRGRQLATLFLTTFRYNFPPSLYYRARLFRLHRARWLAVFSHDEAVALAPVMEQRTREFGLWTKLGWQRFCARHSLPGVNAIARVTDGRVEISDAAAWAKAKDLFVKPDEGWASRGTILLEWQADRQGWLTTGEKIGFCAREELEQFLVVAAAGADLVVQPRLRNHPALADLATRALINFRVLTLREQDGSISVISAALRIPGHAEHCSDVPEGYFVPVNLTDGVLGYAEGLDMTSGLLAIHPVTGVPIFGRKIFQWPDMRGLAVAAHTVMPHAAPCVGWDLVCTDQGVKLLEANVAWSGNLAQLRGLVPLGESHWPAVMLRYLNGVPLETLLAEVEAGRQRAAQSARSRL